MELSRERLRIVEERYYIGSMSRLDLQQQAQSTECRQFQCPNQLEQVQCFPVYPPLNRLMALEDVEEQVQIKDSLITPNPFLDEVERWKSTFPPTIRTKTECRIRLYGELIRLYGELVRSRTTDLQRRLGLNYGVTVGINVFDGFNRKREQRNARIQIQNQELRTQELELGLRADMSNFWMAYRNNLGLGEPGKKRILVAAQENYRIAIDRYKLGDLSGIELREAQNKACWKQKSAQSTCRIFPTKI